MSTRVTGGFTGVSWDEAPVGREPADGGPAHGPRLCRATVSNDFTGGVVASATVCQYTIAYTAEKRGAFTGFEVLTGSVDGRTGSFLLRHSGEFTEDGGVRATLEVVAGSGTGELAGLRGGGELTARAGSPSGQYTLVLD